MKGLRCFYFILGIILIAGCSFPVYEKRVITKSICEEVSEENYNIGKKVIQDHPYSLFDFWYESRNGKYYRCGDSSYEYYVPVNLSNYKDDGV